MSVTCSENRKKAVCGWHKVNEMNVRSSLYSFIKYVRAVPEAEKSEDSQSFGKCGRERKEGEKPL